MQVVDGHFLPHDHGHCHMATVPACGRVKGKAAKCQRGLQVFRRREKKDGARYIFSRAGKNWREKTDGDFLMEGFPGGIIFWLFPS